MKNEMQHHDQRNEANIECAAINPNRDPNAIKAIQTLKFTIRIIYECHQLTAINSLSS